MARLALVLLLVLAVASAHADAPACAGAWPAAASCTFTYGAGLGSIGCAMIQAAPNYAPHSRMTLTVSWPGHTLELCHTEILGGMVAAADRQSAAVEAPDGTTMTCSVLGDAPEGGAAAFECGAEATP